MKKIIFFSLVAFFALFMCSKDKDSTTNDGNNEQIAFYTNSEQCGTIEIELDGVNIGTLNTAYSGSSDPDCGSDNTLTVDVSIGIHDYRAEDNCNHIWTGTIIINQGDCKVKLLNR